MNRLRVRLRGKQIYDIELNEGQTYVAGRRDDCEIVLSSEKGISREHFKLFFNEGSWNVEMISRYGEINFDGNQVQQLILSSGNQFSISSFDFEFYEPVEASSPAPVADSFGDSANLPAVTNGNKSVEFQGSDEKTLIGIAPPVVAFIKVLDAQGEAQETIQLDSGYTWLAGRDPTCQIQIRDQSVSRRQFEVRRMGDNYAIIDLGSVNGTLLNGMPISSAEPTPLKSGDVINVLTNNLSFELYDAHFKNRLELVQLNPSYAVMNASGDATPMLYQAPAQNGVAAYQPPVGVDPLLPPQDTEFSNSKSGKFDFKKNRPKVIIGAVVLLLFVYLVMDDSDKPNTKAKTPTYAPGSPQEAFMKLQPEQQALVRQRYKDAKNLYMQGKYQLAQDEIVKIQSVVPDYEDIKEIERLSKEAIFIQEQQRRQEQIEKEKAEWEEKIQKQASICQKKINPSITMSDLDDCLSSVIEFNPDHPRIVDLKNQVDAILAQREMKAAEKAAYLSEVAKLKAIYDKAQAVQKKGKPIDAIAAYKKVVESKLPDPKGLRAESQRTIASIREMMNSKTATFQAEAEKYYQAQNLKGAILALRKARALDPDNTEITDKIDSYTTELKKNMMVIYQEGILEESFGNVEGGESKSGAKDKWKKILELDIPDGEYYKKAFIKMKKYGDL